MWFVVHVDNIGANTLTERETNENNSITTTL